MDWLLTHLAMALDTLPASGRVMLLAVLLSVAFYGVSRRLLSDNGDSTNLMYHKGALVALLLVPALVYLTRFKLPVHVVEFTQFTTTLPAYVSTALVLVWVGGMLYQAVRLLQHHARGMDDMLAPAAAVANPDMGQAGVADPAMSKLRKRTDHWCRRLHITRAVQVFCRGSEPPWHAWQWGRDHPIVLVLPVAARNWPVGVVDVMLTCQLAQIKQNAWCWMLFARLVQVVYWPLPWVAGLSRSLDLLLLPPAQNLAAAAYRDMDGWRRDLNNYTKRAETLTLMDPAAGVLRLPAAPAAVAIAAALNTDAITGMNTQPASADARLVTFENRWAHTKLKLRDKYRSPYEQAYWLIAGACVAVALATTLTIVQAPPEFDAKFLQVKWQDSFKRRLHDEEQGEQYQAVTAGSDESIDGDDD